MNERGALGAVGLIILMAVVNELLPGDVRLLTLGVCALILMGWLWRSMRT